MRTTSGTKPSTTSFGDLLPDTVRVTEGPRDVRAHLHKRMIVRAWATAGVEGLSDDERREYHRRVDFPGRGRTRIRHALERAMVVNEDSPAGSIIVGVQGPVKAGKSRAVLEAALDVLAADYAANPEIRHADGIVSQRIPAVFVVIDAGGGRALASDICSFMGIPTAVRMTARDLLALASKAMKRSATRLLVIDDLHAMARGTRGDDSTNFLRAMLNRLPATVVFISADLEAGTPVLSYAGATATQARQLVERLDLHAIAPYGSSERAEHAWEEAFTRANGRVLLGEKLTAQEVGATSAWLRTECQGLCGVMYQAMAIAAANAVGTTEKLTVDGLTKARRELRGERA